MFAPPGACFRHAHGNGQKLGDVDYRYLKAGVPLTLDFLFSCVQIRLTHRAICDYDFAAGLPCGFEQITGKLPDHVLSGHGKVPAAAIGLVTPIDGFGTDDFEDCVHFTSGLPDADASWPEAVEP